MSQHIAKIETTVTIGTCIYTFTTTQFETQYRVQVSKVATVKPGIDENWRYWFSTEEVASINEAAEKGMNLALNNSGILA